MPCFFCSSDSHISQFCDVNVDDKTRKEIIESKNYCCFSLNVKNSIHDIERNCEVDRECYICFSRTHHTFLCPERLTAPEVFVPKIDNDLMKRFTETLTLEEKFFLASTVPNFAVLINFRRLRIVDDKQFRKDLLANYHNDVFANYFRINNVDSPLFDTALLQKIICKSAVIILMYSQISPEDLFFLLSTKTTELQCHDVFFYPCVKFSDILMKTPNIEIFKMNKTYIEIESIWIQDLLMHKNGCNFRDMVLLIESRKFSLTDLATFMKTKCAKNVKIELISVVSPHIDYYTGKFRNDLMKEYEQYFIPTSNASSDQPSLTLSIKELEPDKLNYYDLSSEKFILKVDIS